MFQSYLKVLGKYEAIREMWEFRDFLGLKAILFVPHPGLFLLQLWLVLLLMFSRRLMPDCQVGLKLLWESSILLRLLEKVGKILVL